MQSVSILLSYSRNPVLPVICFGSHETFLVSFFPSFWKKNVIKWWKIGNSLLIWLSALPNVIVATAICSQFDHCLLPCNELLSYNVLVIRWAYNVLMIYPFTDYYLGLFCAHNLPSYKFPVFLFSWKCELLSCMVASFFFWVVLWEYVYVHAEVHATCASACVCLCRNLIIMVHGSYVRLELLLI